MRESSLSQSRVLLRQIPDAKLQTCKMMFVTNGKNPRTDKLIDEWLECVRDSLIVLGRDYVEVQIT